MKNKKNYSDEDLKLLNSDRALRFLVNSDTPDYDGIIHMLRFEKKLRVLQAELLQVQKFVVENGVRVLIVVEGREFAGKGGLIRTFTEHLNPRSVRIVALPRPDDRERGEWYFQRYIKNLPARGELVFFDRSWYNRAMVEPVNGFCTKKEYKQFMRDVPDFERMLTSDGIVMIKLYLLISKKEQGKRIREAGKNPLRKWEITAVDRDAVKLWDKYSKYEKAMLEKTHFETVPWHVIEGDDKLEGRLEAFRIVLDRTHKLYKTS